MVLIRDQSYGHVVLVPAEARIVEVDDSERRAVDQHVARVHVGMDQAVGALRTCRSASAPRAGAARRQQQPALGGR